MKSAVFYGPLDLRLEEKDVPRPGNGEIVIKVEVSGLCPSDVRIYKYGSASVRPPVTLGHEFSGYVCDVGQTVDGVRESERVNVAADAFCGVCRMCRMGHENLCEMSMVFGYNVDGAHSEYVLIPKRWVDRGGVFSLPSDVGSEEASMTEPLACALNTIETLGSGPGKTIVVIGDGPMGLLHVSLAKLYGADQIILVGLMGWKLRLGQELGATSLANQKEDDPVKAVMEATNGVGADIIAITAVTPQTIMQGLKMASKRAYVSIFGGTPKGVTAEIEPNLLHYREAFLTGNSGYTYAQYAKALRMIASHRIPVGRLVTHRFPLEAIHEAIKIWDDKENSLKIMLTR
jgi:L-iditol 2-dehydrogenase